MMNLTKKTLVSILISFVISILNISFTNETQPKLEKGIPIVIEDFSEKDSIRSLLVQEVDNYIGQSYPKSKLTGAAIVCACETHNFDPCFLLAQGIIESGLGTAGKAAHTGSPWNVGQYDGRSINDMKKCGLSYNDPNDAIEPYILLVKNKYLGEKRTYNDLMNNYITLSGHRYASNGSYEKNLALTYHKIKSKTGIYNLFIELMKI